MAEIAEDARRELEQVGHRWAEAERGGDTAVLDELLSDDFVGVGPLGFLLTKEQWIGRYTSGDLVNQEFGFQQAAVRGFGTTAVVIGIQTQDTTYQGRPVASGRFRLTQVLDRASGTWRLVSVHLSNLADQAA